ncbi:MAG: glycosyltransferase family 2 protein [Candidatus Hodarchaeales archaeon]
MEPYEYLLPGAAIFLGLVIILLLPKSYKAWLWTVAWLIIGYLAINTKLVEELSKILKIRSLEERGLLAEAIFTLALILVLLLIAFVMYMRINRMSFLIARLLRKDNYGDISKVSLILPAYNEEANIEQVVRDLHQTVADFPVSTEIIVVNDGSKDRTGELCDQLKEELPTMRVIHQENQGKTFAFANGVRQAAGEMVVMLETDQQYNPEDMRGMVAAIAEGYDVANGWRIGRSDRIHRTFLSSSYNFLVRHLFGTGIRDHNSGFKAFRKEAFLRIIESLQRLNLGGPHRYFLAAAIALDLKLTEVPVRHYARGGGQSYINPIKTPLQTFRDMLKLRLVLSWRKSKFLRSKS